MLNVCYDLFEAWNQSAILYCHWKSNEHLEEGLNGLTDLDVYVSKTCKDKAEKELQRLKYIKFRPQKSARYKDVDEWIGFDYETGKIVHVHLHYKIITGTKFVKEYEFPIEEEIIKTRVMDKKFSVYITAPELEIIILYTRIALKAKDKKHIVVKSDDEKEIAFLKERIDKEELRSNCLNLLGDNGEKFYALIEKEKLNEREWHEVFLCAKLWLKRHKRMSQIASFIRHKWFYYRNIYHAIIRKRLHKNTIGKKTLSPIGKSVCFLGADGSGKSTVSCEIEKWLTWKIEANRFYLGSGDHYNSFIKRLIRKANLKIKSSKKQNIVKTQDAKPKSDVQPKKKESLFRQLAKTVYSVLNSMYLKQIAIHSYSEIKKAQKYIKKGAVALYDRFPQNQFAGMYDGPKIRIRYQKMGIIIKCLAVREEKAINKAQKYQPDLMFKLVLPAEESIRRKPDHTIEEVRPKAEMTEKLIFNNSKVFVIDATQPYEKEILEIKRIIWDELLNDN